MEGDIIDAIHRAGGVSIENMSGFSQKVKWMRAGIIKRLLLLYCFIFAVQLYFACISVLIFGCGCGWAAIHVYICVYGVLYC